MLVGFFAFGGLEERHKLLEECLVNGQSAGGRVDCEGATALENLLRLTSHARL